MLFKLLFEVHFGFVFEFVLELFDLKDAFGVDHIFVKFHEGVDGRVFWGHAVFEKVFEVGFVHL